MAGPHLQVVAQQLAEQAPVAGVDRRVQPVAAQVGALARHLDAGGHAAHVPRGLEHGHLVTGTGRPQRREQARRPRAHDHDVRGSAATARREDDPVLAAAPYVVKVP